MTLRFQRFAVPLALGAILFAGSAQAGGTSGLNLSWDECGVAGVQDKTVANCTASNTGQNTMFASFVAPAGIAALASADIFINIVVATPALEAWWDIGSLPACRPPNSLQMNFTSPCGSATDYWGSVAGGPLGGSSYIKDPQGSANQVGGPNHAGFRGIVAVDVTQTGPVAEGDQVYLCTVTLRNLASTTCVGCATPACFLFNNVNLEQSGTTVVTSVFGPPTGGRDFVTWQGGVGAPCAEVPVKNQTWGQIKSVYR